MHRLRRLLALALLALWLPATLHCDLEAAGLDELFHCVTDHHSADRDQAAPSAAHHDACDVVESDTFQPAANTAILPPPSLCAVLLCFVLPPPALALNPPPSGLTDRLVAPREVARTWHFVARAALPARAPSLV